MTTPTFSYSQVSALRPCRDGLKAAAGKLGGVAAWKARGFTFREMADAGIPFDDLIWLVSAAARNEPDIERRVRLWVADCAARVLPIFEREMPGDSRPRQAIEAGRGFARGAVSDAARDAAGDAAGDAARDAWDAARDAWDAARDARAAARDAWDAARAAWAAASDAARAAARDARDAENAWQIDRLCLWMSEQEPQDWPLALKTEDAA